MHARFETQAATFALAAVVLALSASQVGCGDACSDASEKTAECGIITDDVENDEENQVECAGEIECSANCVTDASCEDLQNRGDQDTALADCVRQCQNSS